jgi:hypothetical protein
LWSVSTSRARVSSTRAAVLVLLLAPFAMATAQDVVVQDTTPPLPIRVPVRVCAGGDMTFGTNLDTAWAKIGAHRLRQLGRSPEPDSLLAPLRPLFADADVLLLNVETAMGTGPATRKCGPRAQNCYAFRAPPSAAGALRALGDSGAVVVGNVANNHARDAGPRGLDTTIALLRRAGVHVTGADTLATPVLLPDSSTIGILGFYTSFETPDLRDLAAVRRHVARAAEMYGTVIVTAHMGAEGIGAQRTRDSVELFLASKIDRGNPVAFARAAFEAGASLVVGHGPHVLRAVEWNGDKLALYSLGNLMTYGPFNNAEPLNRGAVACIDLDSGRVVGAQLRPTIQVAPGVVLIDGSYRAMRLIDSLGVLDFPTTGARVDVWGDLIRPSSPPDSVVAPRDTAVVRPDTLRWPGSAAPEGEHATRAHQRPDEPRSLSVERAHNHATGDAARVHELPVAHVNPDVRHAVLAECEQVARLQALAFDRRADKRLAKCGAR